MSDDLRPHDPLCGLAGFDCDCPPGDPLCWLNDSQACDCDLIARVRAACSEECGYDH